MTSITDTFPTTGSSTNLRSYPSLLTDLAGYWNLSGFFNDSLNISNLTAYGSPTGDAINGCAFNGSNQYLSCADNSNLQFFSEDYTIAFWVSFTGYAPSNGAYQVIAKDAASNRGWGVYLNGGSSYDPRMTFFHVDTGGTAHFITLNASFNSEVNQWHFMYLQNDSSSQTLTAGFRSASTLNYPNFVTGSTTYTGTLNNTEGNSLWLGTDQDESGYLLSGHMGPTGIWSKQLSSTELGYVFNNGQFLFY